MTGDISTRLNIEDPLSSNTLEFLKQVSMHSYLDLESLRTSYQKDCPNALFLEDTKTDGQVFILPFQDFTIVAFRGSELKLKDWVTNFKCLPTKTPYGWAHYGFTTAFLRLWPELKAKIDPTKRLIITGHSLGGALAHLCSVWASDELKIRPLVVTFGQPRVGFFKFSKMTSEYISGRFFRIVKIFDPVPKVPPYLFFYRHPRFTAYKRLSNGIGHPQNFFERHFWEMALSGFLAFSGYMAFISHSIGNY